MFIPMLNNQRVTFVSDALQAEAHSPFVMRHNPVSGKYVVCRIDNGVSSCVAAGMELDEAQACIMFKANEHIYPKVQKGS